MKQLFAALALLAISATAQAQLTTNVGAVSDYRFRGVSQTQNSVALQGGVDYAHKSGFYVGNWNSTVSSQVYTDSTGLEMDVYGGFKTEIAKGLRLDVGSYNYLYSQAGNQFRSVSNTNELYVGLEYGPAAVKYSQAVSDYFGLANSKGTQYLQADVNWPVNKDLTANAHIGRTLVSNYSDRDYTDVRVGATMMVQGFSVGAHYVTNLGEGSNFNALNTVGGQHLYKDTLVVSVTRQF
jgi:uncharacterized protein (TIGR02001 family)